ncbi:hypothetical protein IJ384_03610 [bacterium]|nr:hypothetical protein [bacterium]
MNKIHPNATFSYNLIKGSLEKRRQLVSELNERFFDSIQQSINSGKRTKLGDLKKIYQEILPEKKNILISKINSNSIFAGASNYTYDDYSGDITGVTIEIPIKNSRIEMKSLPTIMHENTHVLTTLAQPKHTALTQKLNKQGLLRNDYDNWYQDYLYKEENINEDYSENDMITNIIEATKKFLSGKSLKDKIHYLQDARYQLEQEVDAYAEELKFAKRLEQVGIKLDEEDLINGNEIYLFKTKIDILKKMIADLISKKRQKNFEKYGHINKFRL